MRGRLFCAATLSLVMALLFCGGHDCCAQFKDEAFTQNYNEPGDTTGKSDTTKQMFSLREYFGALAHKNTTTIGSMFAGSVIVVGGCQIYNKDYWKLPIVYGGIGAGAGVGGYYLSRYNKSVKAFENWEADRDIWLIDNPGGTYPVAEPLIDSKAKTIGTWSLVGAGVVYWWSLMDGIIRYPDTRKPSPGKSTLYAIICPGLGQAYNGEYWKIPIYYGGLITAGYFLYTNNLNYQHYRQLYKDISAGTVGDDCPFSAGNAKYYRDTYRRFRDYSILATAAVYLLQVIDANVFSYMNDFEVSDDISFRMQPSVIPPGNSYAFGGRNAYGMSIGIKF